MKWTIIFIFMIMNMLLPAVDVNAEGRDIAPAQKDNVDSAAADEILTAIDIADLMQRGVSDADIVKLLSDRRGYDRLSALNKGNTDEQTIAYLIVDQAKNTIDDKKYIQHKNAGDMYLNKSQYDKAAKEYTLASMYSDNKYEPLKLRADAYKLYLTNKLSPASRDNADEAKRNLFDKSKQLLCRSIDADYKKAMQLNDKRLSAITLETNVLKDKMGKKIIHYEKDSKVIVSRYRGGQNIHDMRRLDVLYRSIRAARKDSMAINKAMSDSKLVCETKGDAARQEFK